VPGGVFLLGTDQVVFELDAEGPAMAVEVAPFAMDQFEVSSSAE
jgi:formylglycine-generating enzyme required for sulfatase activity